VPEPLVDLGHVLVLELTELELARVERRFSTAAPDTHSRGEPPEMAPAPSKHACPHGLRSRQEAEDVLEDAVRHGVYAASAAIRRRHRHLAVFYSKHSVKQVLGADRRCGTKKEETIRGGAKRAEKEGGFGWRPPPQLSGGCFSCNLTRDVWSLGEAEEISGRECRPAGGQHWSQNLRGVVGKRNNLDSLTFFRKVTSDFLYA